MTFATRYLSIDADEVIQGPSKPSFKIYNLATDPTFIGRILADTGFNTYKSKTLQVDFERKTSVKNSAGAVVGKDGLPVGPTICRYDSGKDLFSGDHTLPLMAEYSATEVNDLFKNIIAVKARTVDRYVSLKGDSNNHYIGALSIAKCELNIYANYVYVDGITDIYLLSLDGDLKFHSQESGYTETEYLGFFTKHSAESYNGTLVYFPEDVYFHRTILGSRDRIAAGFYYVPTTDTGTSIRALANGLFTGDPKDNTENKPYRVEPDDLKNYSVYINPDGSISNAYVDTGIFDNTSSSLGGFSGGNVG